MSAGDDAAAALVVPFDLGLESSDADHPRLLPDVLLEVSIIGVDVSLCWAAAHWKMSNTSQTTVSTAPFIIEG